MNIKFRTSSATTSGLKEANPAKIQPLPKYRGAAPKTKADTSGKTTRLRARPIRSGSADSWRMAKPIKLTLLDWRKLPARARSTSDLRVSSSERNAADNGTMQHANPNTTPAAIVCPERINNSTWKAANSARTNGRSKYRYRRITWRRVNPEARKALASAASPKRSPMTAAQNLPAPGAANSRIWDAGPTNNPALSKTRPNA